MHPHSSRRFFAVALAGVIAMMLVSACSSPADRVDGTFESIPIRVT